MNNDCYRVQGRNGVAFGALVAALGCNLSTLEVNTARFELVNGQGDTRTILTTLPASKGTSVGLSEGELGAGARVCLADLEGRLERFGYPSEGNLPAIRTEAHIYLRDPNEVHDTLGAMTDADILNGRWAEEVGSPHGRPLVAVMPAPLPSPSSESSYQIPLGTVYYPTWGSSASSFYVKTHPSGYQCHPLTGPVQNAAGHAARGLALYDRGLCENTIDVSSGVISPLLAQTWIKITSGLKHAGAVSTKRRYNISSSYVRFDNLEVKGGVFWAFHFVANDETHLWGNYRLEYELNGMGVPSVAIKELSYESKGGLSPSWGSWIRNGSSLNKPLRTELVNGFEEASKASLTLNSVQVASSTPCRTNESQPELAVSCERAASDFAAFVVPSSAVSPAGAVYTATESDHLRCSIGDTASCTAINRDPLEIRARRWTCGEADEGSTDGLCQFVLPVKRLNPFPDKLHLVFFDSTKEVDNAALAVATQPLYRSQICAVAEPIPTDLLQTTFKVLLRTPAASGVDIDPWPN